MEIEEELHLAEVNRLKAEQFKLELEAQEIERRLNTSWWQGQKLAQYLVAIIVTSALLFGWTRVYLEPILRQETELTTLAEQRNAALNELLEAENKRLINDRKVLQQDRANLTGERDQLKDESETLKKNQDELKLVVAGLNLAVDRVASGKEKFFSILNNGDPINKLKSAYGWHMYSSDYFKSQLGYYLIINHKNVMSNNKIFVGRTIEINRLKRNEPRNWHNKLKLVTDKAPILALDYSYFGLLVDESAPVGGTIYLQNGERIEFYAPLDQWSEKLGMIFQRK